MNDIDAVFSAIRDAPVPSRLYAIDDTVIEGLDAYREHQFSRRGLILATVVAGTIGFTFGIGSGTPASAEPILGVPASAPSHLLAD